ncbi:hypothetical protein BDN72DRAFT_432592 [Pluteus cervinus]|uniref:Uncharacterized protein n=1 Tax=Pluteus cervinus TaxID=181527 RepID=A0ACD3B1U6_9AGAR|nr:hypothetical protein BDN72DRAFT_432592 [Pluteus cervinus]
MPLRWAISGAPCLGTDQTQFVLVPHDANNHTQTHAVVLFSDSEILIMHVVIIDVCGRNQWRKSRSTRRPQRNRRTGSAPLAAPCDDSSSPRSAPSRVPCSYPRNRQFSCEQAPSNLQRNRLDPVLLRFQLHALYLAQILPIALYSPSESFIIC